MSWPSKLKTSRLMLYEFVTPSWPARLPQSQHHDHDHAWHCAHGLLTLAALNMRMCSREGKGRWKSGHCMQSCNSFLPTSCLTRPYTSNKYGRGTYTPLIANSTVAHALGQCHFALPCDCRCFCVVTYHWHVCKGTRACQTCRTCFVRVTAALLT